MLSAEDLAAKALIGAAEHKRTATTLRRLAGGIQVQRDGPAGLSESEKRVLADAIALLVRMASLSERAGKAVASREEGQRRRRADMAAALQSTFGALTSVADKVALVGAVTSSSLRGPLDEWVSEPGRLDEVFREALADLAWRLAGEDGARPVDAVAGSAWAKFVDGRAAIEDRHAHLIVALQRVEAGN